jgi:hypothetical protein
MYLVKSSIKNLPPDKQRKATKIVLGVNILSKPKGFEVDDLRIFNSLDSVIELMAKGEIEVFEGVERRTARDLKVAKNVLMKPAPEEVQRRPRPKDEEPKPAPAPEPEPTPEPEPEPEPEPPADEPADDEENGYTLEDLKAMKVKELKVLADEMEVEYDSRERHDDLVKLIWKAL